MPSIPHRRHHAARAAACAPPLGLPGRRLARGGRLRQRVPLRGPPPGGTPVIGPRRPRDLHRHLFEDALPRPACGLSRAAPPLARPFIAAKWAADRFSAPLAQEALTDFITSGQFERYLRRAGARNASRRQALIEALRRHFGSRVEIAGENTGVHLVVWFNDVRPRELDAIIARAARAGVSVYSIAPAYTHPLTHAGLLFGYAALTEPEIRAGIRRLAELF